MDKITLDRLTLSDLDPSSGYLEFQLEFTVRDGGYRITEECEYTSPGTVASELLERLHEAAEAIIYQVHSVNTVTATVYHREALAAAIESWLEQHLPRPTASQRSGWLAERREQVLGAEIPLESSAGSPSGGPPSQYEMEMNRARNLLRDGMFGSALEVLTGCHRAEPDNMDIRVAMADCRLRLHEPLDAWKDLMEVVKAGHLPVEDLMLRLLEKLRMHGRHNEADRLLEAYEAIAPGQPLSRLEQAWRAYRDGDDPIPALTEVSRTHSEFVRRYLRNQWRFVSFPQSTTPLPLRDAAVMIGLPFDELKRLAKRQGVPARYLAAEDVYLFTREDVESWLALNARFGFFHPHPPEVVARKVAEALAKIASSHRRDNEPPPRSSHDSRPGAGKKPDKKPGKYRKPQ